MSFDSLQEKIIQKKNPTVAGLDPRPEQIPPHILKEAYGRYGETLEGAAQAVWQFNQGLMDALCDVVPAVKPQAAYYERLGWHGMAVLERTIAYADAWLGETQVGAAAHAAFGADCVTLNGYMGSDTVEPFVETCKRYGKCLFLLAKTSNPGSGELQNLTAGEKKVYQLLGDMAEKLGADTQGKYGYGLAGAVTGATYPEELSELRARLPHTFFLVPGYGAQGGTAQDVQHAFDNHGRGAIVNASRSIMCAWQKTGRDGLDYQEAARAAAEEMRDAIGAYVTIR